MSEQHEKQSGRGFYDLNTIKSIPILDVCKVWGIPVEHRNNSIWCKARAEKTASALLHPDKNTFYDFGSSTGGDVIEFVSFVEDIQAAEAIRRLASAFDIQPMDRRQGLDSSELSAWEYANIGIAGDLATKNFEFHAERTPIQRMYELSVKYAMPMNELRKKHPKIYENILRRKALPFVRELRNSYFLSVWSQYQTMCNIGNPDLFYQPEMLSEFDAQIKELKIAERTLVRAAEGTSLTFQSEKDGYDPSDVLKRLSDGKLTPTLGTASYHEMAEAAKEAGCAVKYQVMEHGKYILSDLDQHFHSAFLSSGRVVVGFLECDRALLQPIFDQAQSSHSAPIQKRSNTAELAQAPARKNGSFER